MKRIGCPFPVCSRARSLCLTLIVGVLVAAAVSASTRPKYGGTLRVQIRERIANLDPRQWPPDPVQAAAAERVDGLVFDRLLRLDEHGTPHPVLASWSHNDNLKFWDFHLIEGVKFSDGSPLTPEVAAFALQQSLGNAFEVRAGSQSVTIRADHPAPDLPEQLATGRNFIFRVTNDGGVVGTGPFQVDSWPSDAASKAVLTANDFCKAGRPFVDTIELTMGASFEQQANAVAFGEADVVELPASDVRRAVQRGVRTASSDPTELFAILFDLARPALQDARVRQAISLAIDRASIADVILQRQGTVAESLLPNWVSGYAHLFPVSLDLPRAKELVAASGHELSRSSPLVLVYDSGDADARAVADRVAVNLREVGIIVRVSGQKMDEKLKSSAVDMRLVRQRIIAPDPGIALSELLNSFGEATTNMETPEQMYEAERTPIDAFRVIPLAHVTESYGLSRQVRDWMPQRWGGWRLEDVWLEPSAEAGRTPQ